MLKLEMSVLVNVKNCYGNILYYPACRNAKLFAEIAGSKTLTADTMRKIKQLGIAVTSVTSQI